MSPTVPNHQDEAGEQLGAAAGSGGRGDGGGDYTVGGGDGEITLPLQEQHTFLPLEPTRVDAYVGIVLQLVVVADDCIILVVIFFFGSMLLFCF